MKIYEIENFIEVCRYNSFSKAAQAPFISRQSLLRSINNLEDELEYPLFSRGPMGITLTEFGQAFYMKAVEAVDKLEELKQVSEEFKKRERQHISIGIRGTFRSSYIMRKIIEHFEASHPEIDVEIVDCDSNSIVSYVREGKMDLGFTIVAADDSQVQYFALEKLEYAFLTNKKNHLADKELITPKDLDGETLVSAAFSDHPAKLLSEFAAQENSRPHIATATMDMGLMYQLAHNNEASGILLLRDGRIGEKLYDDIVCIPFDPVIAIHMGLVFRKGHSVSEAQRLFVNYTRKSYSSVKKQEKILDKV